VRRRRKRRRRRRRRRRGRRRRRRRIRIYSLICDTKLFFKVFSNTGILLLFLKSFRHKNYL
jgi:hypothetical protein